MSVDDYHHQRGYFIMRLRRIEALGYPKRIRYLSYKRLIAYYRCEAAVAIQKIFRGFIARVHNDEFYNVKYFIVI